MRKKSILLVMSAAMLLCVAACGGSTAAERVAVQYVKAYMKPDYKAMKALLCKEQLRLLDATQPQVNSNVPKPDLFDVKAVESRQGGGGDDAEIWVQVSVSKKGEGKPYHVGIGLNKENGDWKVAQMRTF
jgi:hypothetical protein